MARKPSDKPKAKKIGKEVQAEAMARLAPKTKPIPKASGKPKPPPADPDKPRKRGAPSVWTQEIADEICERMANGETLLRICKDEHIPSRKTINRWVAEDRNHFQTQYARAQEERFDYWADETLEVAKDGSNDWIERENKDGSKVVVLNHEHVQRSKLIIENMRWLMERGNPKKYGSKVEIDTPADGGLAKAAAVTMGALAALAGKAA